MFTHNILTPYFFKATDKIFLKKLLTFLVINSHTMKAGQSVKCI